MTQTTTAQEKVARAVRAREERRFAESLQLLQDALAAGEPPENVYFQMGNTYFDSGKLSDAEKAYQAALTANSAHYKAMHNLGVVYRRQGRITDSVRCIKTAARLQIGLRNGKGQPNGVPVRLGEPATWLPWVAFFAALLAAGWLLGGIR